MAARSMLLAALALFAVVNGASAACPSLSASDVPASCKSPDKGVVCGACVDEIFAVIQGKLGPNTPCSQNLGSCVSSAAPAFVGAKANVNALLNCNADETAARLQPRLQCQGTKPTASELASQLRAVGH